MTGNLNEQIHTSLRRVFAAEAAYPDETAFQVAFAAALGSSERELRARFAPAAYPPLRPPLAAIQDLAKRKSAIQLPPEGKDPCSHAAKLDVLWSSEAGPVAIELKYRTHWNADTYGYQFLKDLHRLERMTSVGRHAHLSGARFAIFVTTESVYWKGAKPEPEPFWLTEGRRIGPRHWVQYDKQSPDTRWSRYPPFYLANSYQFAWRDLGPAGRYLLVEAKPQGQP